MDLQFIFEYLSKEWSVIKQAPFIFLLAIIILGLIINSLLSFHYKERINATQAKYELEVGKSNNLKEELENKAKKLSVQDKVISELTDKLTEVESRISNIEPRSLKDEQISKLQEKIGLYAKRNYIILITSDMGCEDCKRYADDIANIFKQSIGWQLRRSSALGVTSTSRKGILLIHSQDEKSLELSKILSEILDECDINHDVESHDSFAPDNYDVSLLITRKLD